MSYTAISAVTTAIRKLFKGKMRTTQLITFLPPGDDDLEKLDGLNIYLYRVVENPYFKNRDWIGDRSNPGLPYPPLALNLLYLLTPYTKKVEDTDEALSHRILGDAMQVLHENPVLNEIHDGTFDADRDLDIDLLNSFEKVKITLFPISMDEMSKIWSASGKPYRLSVIYEVSLVQIAPAIKPKVISSVMKVEVEVAVPSPPFISDVSPPSGDVGSVITLSGSNFIKKGFETLVYVNGTEVRKKTSNHSEIVFDFPDIPGCGHDAQIGVSVGNESAAAIFIVSPWIGRISPIRGCIDSTKPFELIISGDGFKGSVNVIIDGADIIPVNITESELKVNIPPTMNNGIKKISVMSDGKRSNSMSFEVVPLLKSLSFASGRVGQPVVITGERLNRRAQINFGNTILDLNTNTLATELTFKIPSISPGEYPVIVVIDGHISNSLSFEVTL